jgi:hypothetical protein
MRLPSPVQLHWTRRIDPHMPKRRGLGANALMDAKWVDRLVVTHALLIYF